MPPKKRKSNDYLDQIMDMKRKREAGGQPDDLDEGGVRGDNVGPSFEFSAGSAAEMFSKIMLQASPDDIYGEYLWFVKNLPKMINNKLSDLLHLVRTELGVERVKGLLCGKLNFTGNNFPILDALSCKVKINLRNIIAPPTTTCLLCAKPLTANNEPSHVPLHTPNGPELATKYSWECRSCNGVGNFGLPVQLQSTNRRIYYQVDQFGK